jgi:hypothetical protein
VSGTGSTSALDLLVAELLRDQAVLTSSERQLLYSIAENAANGPGQSPEVSALMAHHVRQAISAAVGQRLVRALADRVTHHVIGGVVDAISGGSVGFSSFDPPPIFPPPPPPPIFPPPPPPPIAPFPAPPPFVPVPPPGPIFPPPPPPPFGPPPTPHGPIDPGGPPPSPIDPGGPPPSPIDPGGPPPSPIDPGGPPPSPIDPGGPPPSPIDPGAPPEGPPPSDPGEPPPPPPDEAGGPDPSQLSQIAKMEEVLNPEVLEALIRYAIASQLQFRPVASIAPGITPDPVAFESRETLLLSDPREEFRDTLTRSVRDSLPKALELLRLRHFQPSRTECYIAAIDERHTLRVEGEVALTEERTRAVAWIVFIYRDSLGFRGGDLQISRAASRSRPTDSQRLATLTPTRNTLVLFPAGLTFAIMPVTRPSDSFADCLFVAHGWIHD